MGNFFFCSAPRWRFCHLPSSWHLRFLNFVYTVRINCSVHVFAHMERTENKRGGHKKVHLEAKLFVELRKTTVLLTGEGVKETISPVRPPPPLPPATWKVAELDCLVNRFLSPLGNYQRWKLTSFGPPKKPWERRMSGHGRSSLLLLFPPPSTVSRAPPPPPRH